MTTADAVGANSTWVLSNHDVVRHLTRYARSQPDHLVESDWDRDRWAAEPADLKLGTRRARAATLLTLALPGVAYIYQGEELGLEEVVDLPSELRQDPTWWQSDYTNPGRDGCRVPLPWSGSAAPYGFSPDGAAPTWLPQPDRWAELTVEQQDLDPDSTLNLYRTALRLRREHQHGVGAVTWIDSPEGTLAFRRGDMECWINTSESAIDLPAGEVLVCSDPHAQQGELPVDAAVWLVVT
jgi:alpha-glucosidase